MTRLLVAVHFFFDRWEDPAERTLWLTIQPYFNLAEGGFKALRDWIADPRATDFELIDLNSQLIPDLIVPVPLPPPMEGFCEEVVVGLHESDDFTANPAFRTAIVNRSNAFEVQSSGRLFEINHRLDEQDPDGHHGEYQLPLSYPALFWTDLQDAAAPEKLSDEDLKAWLVHAFEVGQRIYFDQQCVTAEPGWFDATPPFKEAFIGSPGVPWSASNRHCLLGHMLSLGGDIDELQRTRAVSIAISGTTRLDLTGARSGDRLPTMFKSIAAGVSKDAEESAEAAQDWDSGLAKRVHAIPIGEGYVAQRIHATDEWIWRQRRGQSNSAEALPTTRWSEFERLVIRYGRKDKEASIPPELSGIDEFRVRPEITLDARIEIYRNFPLQLVDGLAADGANPTIRLARRVIVKVAPAVHELARFRSLTSSPQNRAWFRRIGAAPSPDGAELLLYRFPFNPNNVPNQPGELIEPAWIAPLSFPWNLQGEYELLACFEVDTTRFRGGDDSSLDRAAVAMLRDSLEGSALIRLRLPARSDLLLPLCGYDPDGPGGIDLADPFGPRWDYWHTGDRRFDTLPDFDALSIVALPEKAEQFIPQLIVTGVERDRRAFEWSQSARRLEGVVTASCDVLDVGPDDPVDVFTAEQACSEDRINFNSLNIVETRSSRWEGGPHVTRFLNHSSELSPVFYSSVTLHQDSRTQPNKRVTYVFHCLFTDRTSAPMWEQPVGSQVWQQVRWQIGQDGDDIPTARQFYSAVYGFAGTGRDLALSLEHTYGCNLQIAPVVDVPDLLDEPVIVGADVSHQGTDGGSSESRLWRISLAESILGKATSATLHLNASMLSEDWVKDGTTANERAARNRTYNSAWQSIAEIAHGLDQNDQHTLRVCAERFLYNAYQAMDQVTPSISGGLSATVQEFPPSVTRPIFLAAIDWLKTGNGEKEFHFEVPQSWGRDFHALRFRFDLKRSPGMAPVTFATEHACPYVLKTRKQRLEDGEDPRVALFDEHGLKMIDADSPALKLQLKGWVDKLNHAGAYIPATGTAGRSTRSAPLRAVLGAVNDRLGAQLMLPPAITEADDAWIAPIQTVNPGGDLSLLYCPVGFEPLARDPFLQEQSALLIRRYFAALQAIMEMRPRVLGEMLAAELWSLLNQWGGEGTDGMALRAVFCDLAAAAAGKLFAVPDPDAEGLDRIIADVAARIDHRDEGLGKELHAWFHESFRRSPGGFDDLKAFGVIEVAGADFSTKLRTDFHALTMKRRIRDSEPATITSKCDISSSGFPDPAAGRLAFVEPLLDSTYDNDFKILDVQAETVERVLEQRQAAEGEPPPPDVRIPVHRELIHVPEEAPIHISDGAPVYLASRTPVVNPSLAFISEDRINVQEGDQYALSEFLKGVLRIASKQEPAVVRICRQAVEWPPRIAVDEMVLGGLFGVSGDEEQNQGNLEEFRNDAFHMLLTSRSGRGVSKRPRSYEPPTPVKSAFDALSQGTQFERILNPEDFLSLDTIRFVREAVARPLLQSAAPGVDSSLTFGIGDQDGIPIVRIKHATAGLRYQVSVFRQVDRNAASNQRPRYFVFVELVVSIWDGLALALVQTRNEALPWGEDGQQRFFARRFMTVSDRVGDAARRKQSTIELGECVDYRTIPLRDLTPLEFCKGLLTELAAGEDFGGTRHRLTVTIKEDSAVLLPAADGRERWLPNGSFAIRSVEVGASSDGLDDWRRPVQWFPPPVAKRYRVDFEWRDPSTNQFLLRIGDVPVMPVQNRESRDE